MTSESASSPASASAEAVRMYVLTSLMHPSSQPKKSLVDAATNPVCPSWSRMPIYSRASSPTT
ncbi:hypothetical protein ACFPRL_01795 [Pseudoclavibacter helvolus]